MKISGFHSLSALLLTFAIADLSSQQPRLVRDINTIAWSEGSKPDQITSAGAVTYFSAETDAGGRELYQAIAATRSVRLVRDIHPGAGSSVPLNLTVVGSVLYFTADDGVHGRELWRSDGTQGGTYMVRDIWAGSGESYPTLLVPYGNLLVFAATLPASGYELWKTDGTAAGTVMIKDLNPGPGASIKWVAPIEFNGALYFEALDGQRGRELWRTDGTSRGTVLVADLATGSASSSPAEFVVIGRTMFFSASTPQAGFELWKTDGTTAGTIMVRDIRLGSESSGRFQAYGALGNTLLFTANRAGRVGRELWRSDGTTAGTVFLADVQPFSFAELGGKAYFAERGEIWVTDGTSAGTKRFFDGGSFASTPVRSGSLMYFTAYDRRTTFSLFVSDGSVNGTRAIQSFARFPIDQVVPAGGAEVVFRADDGIHGIEPWVSDGTVAGTRMLQDIVGGTGATMSSSPSGLTSLGGTFMMAANDGHIGREPWVSDGTSGGTYPLADIEPGAKGSDPLGFTEVAGRVYFSAHKQSTGRELWVWDQGQGARQVVDLMPGAESSDPFVIGSNGEKVMILVKGPNVGRELHVTDGTASGTQLIRDIQPGAGSAYLTSWQQVGRRVVMVLGSSSQNQKLWVTDGTPAGTKIVKDFRSGRGLLFARITRVGRYGYFSANDGVDGYELWRTDGTPAGTVMLKDIQPGYRSSNPRDLAEVDGRLFFTATGASLRRELWVTDGTIQGTTLVPLSPSTTIVGSIGSGSGELYYFLGDDGVHGSELWRSDGTSSGTFMVKNIAGGGNHARIGRSVSTGGGRILFTVAATDLWVSDGTTVGTKLIGKLDAPVGLYTLANGHVGFAMETSSYGSEFFVIDMPATTQTVGTGCAIGVAPALSSTSPVLGSSLEVKVADAPKQVGGMLIAGSRTIWPQHLGQACSLYVDLGVPVFAFPFRTDAAGRGMLGFVLPSNNSLLGLRLAVQAAVGPTGSGPLGVDITNAVLLQLGR